MFPACVTPPIFYTESASLAEKYGPELIDQTIKGAESYDASTDDLSENLPETSASTGSPVPAGGPGTEGFVASYNSPVFHRSGCKLAARISPKNVIHYATRDEAIHAGKRACADCGL